MIGDWGGHFQLLICNLIRGNRKRAKALAGEIKDRPMSDGLGILSQNLIEEMALRQSVKNALINTPSVVPVVGTYISFLLLGVENFYILDQSVTLIMALCELNGISIDDDEIEEMIIEIIGQAYDLVDNENRPDTKTISTSYVTKMLPQRYLNVGLNKGMRRFVRSILPFRSRSRLLPIGIGLIFSAYNAYDAIVKIGRLSLERIDDIRKYR